MILSVNIETHEAYIYMYIYNINLYLKFLFRFCLSITLQNCKQLTDNFFILFTFSIAPANLEFELWTAFDIDQQRLS
jgi:hypothetical protein